MADWSMRLEEVRSAANNRAFAVAMRDGRGGGGLRDVVRVVRNSEDGGGREREMTEDLN